MQKITINSANIRVNEESVIFDTGELPDVTIVVEAGTSLKYCFIPQKGSEYVRHIDIGSGATFAGTSIIVVESATLHMTAKTVGDNAKSTLSLLVIAGDGSDITVEGVAKVEHPYRHVSTRVDQTNILLGTGMKVRGVPRLEIATDDIEGGHSCKIHRLGGDAAFYLESRGLTVKHAESLLLNSEILKHLVVIEDEDERKEICYDIHTRLFKKKGD